MKEGYSACQSNVVKRGKGKIDVVGISMASEWVKRLGQGLYVIF